MPQEGRLAAADETLNGRRQPRKDEREVIALAHRHQDGTAP